MGSSAPVIVFGVIFFIFCKGPAFVGVDRGGHGLWSGHPMGASFQVPASPDIPCGIGRQGRVSFRNSRLGTRFDWGCRNQST